MKKIVYILLSMVLIVYLVVHFSFKQNIPYIVSAPPGLTIEKVLDPYSNIKDEELYYISNDKGFFNAEIENKLNTKSISQFYSTGYKNVTTITKKNLLASLSKEIVSMYYHDNEWWAFDGNDTCVAILKDNKDQYYTSIYPVALCK